MWGRTKKSSHFQQHVKLIFKSVFNEVFIFITLQTKTEKVGARSHAPKKCGNAVHTGFCLGGNYLCGNWPSGSCPK